jgi:hypothetical protein
MFTHSISAKPQQPGLKTADFCRLLKNHCPFIAGDLKASFLPHVSKVKERD